MVYDPEKYREKREKVLGIRKRGVGFGTIALLVSVVILAGFSAVTIPQAVSYMNTRHLDDAIFKLESGSSWPQNVLASVNQIDGVSGMVDDQNHIRLVVTYDRRAVTVSQITALFTKSDLTVTLLNQVNHRQHQTTMKNEEEEFETP